MGIHRPNLLTTTTLAIEVQLASIAAHSITSSYFDQAPCRFRPTTHSGRIAIHLLLPPCLLIHSFARSKVYTSSHISTRCWLDTQRILSSSSQTTNYAVDWKNYSTTPFAVLRHSPLETTVSEETSSDFLRACWMGIWDLNAKTLMRMGVQEWGKQTAGKGRWQIWYRAKKECVWRWNWTSRIGRELGGYVLSFLDVLFSWSPDLFNPFSSLLSQYSINILPDLVSYKASSEWNEISYDKWRRWMPLKLSHSRSCRQ